jgi:outer membrane protein assembly factor BamB
MRWIGLAFLSCATAVRAGDDAGRFLPDTRSGLVAKSLPLEWDATKNVAWKATIPGSGWSSPVVWGGRVFVTSTVSDEKQFAPREGLYISDLNGKKPPGTHRWQVHCLDAATGKILWTRTPFEGAMTATIHIKNSLASETPVTDGKHVWAYFGNVGVACFDADGKAVWSHKTPRHKTKMGWGTGSSPAMHDGKLFLVHDNEEESFLVALDALTGKQLWRVARDEGSNWGTPFVWKNSKRTELVTAGTKRTRSYSLDGKPLWELRGMSVLSIPTPFAAGDRLFVSSGYVMDPIQKPVYAIAPGGEGDISLAKGEKSNKLILWSQKQAGAYHPTPVLVGDRLVVLLDRGYVAAYDAATGKETRASKRIAPDAKAFTASPWSYNGYFFCLAEDGTTYVLDPKKDFEVVYRNKLGEMSLATPAVAGGSLYLRTQTALYCLRVKQ